MSEAVASTINPVWAGIPTAADTAFKLFDLGVTIDVDPVGLTSDNNGTFKNDTGGDITLNGLLACQLYASGGATYIFSAGTSPDGVTWAEQPAEAWRSWGAFTRWSGYAFDYKITIPAGHYVGVLVKTAAGTGTIYNAGSGHLVRSDEGSTPSLLDSVCSTFLNNSTANMTVTTSFSRIICVTQEFAGSVGAIQNNSGRITNDTGETITVDGFFFVKSSGAGIISINYQHAPYKNGVAIPASMTTSQGMTTSAQFMHAYFYSVELDPGDYVELCARQTAGGSFLLQTRFLQHVMRSRQ